MEADISIWQKPGHFYFALTRPIAEGAVVQTSRPTSIDTAAALSMAFRKVGQRTS